MRPLRWTWLGRVGYRDAWAAQESLRRAILDGHDAETLLLLEHDPVITLGKNARRGHVLAPPAELSRRGVEVVQSSRGGDVTYHGPGQLVGYPVVRLSRGVLDHVLAMSGAIGDALAPLGIATEFRRDQPGVYAAGAKVAAFGVHVSRRVAIHGFALNLTTDLSAFSLIVPCGCATPATSVERLRGSSPSPAELAPVVAAALAARLGRQEARCAPSDVRVAA